MADQKAGEVLVPMKQPRQSMRVELPVKQLERSIAVALVNSRVPQPAFGITVSVKLVSETSEMRIRPDRGTDLTDCMFR